MVKGVTLLEKRESIKKNLRSLAKRVLFVAIMTITAFGLTELAFKQIAKIEEERCWHVLEDSAQAMNKEITIRFEDNINMMRIASRLMVQANIINSYDEVVAHINSFYDKTIFKNIEVLYPDNTLVFQTGETITVSDKTLFDKLAEKGEHISDRTVDLLDKKSKVVRYYVPIIDGDETVAILVGVIDCAKLSDMFKTKAYDGEAYICLVDRSDGLFVMDDWHDTLGNLYDMNQQKSKKEYERAELIEEVKNGKTGELAYVSADDGEYSYIYYTAAGISDWQLLMVVERQVAFLGLLKINNILKFVSIIELVLLIAYFGLFLGNAKRLKRSKLQIEEQLTISNTLLECIATLSRDTELDKAINYVLKLTAEYFQGDRAYLFEVDYKNKTTSNTYEYAVNGVTKEIDNLQNVPISAVLDWIKNFEKCGMFCILDLDKEIDKNSNTYSILKAQNIHSLISVPLKRGNEIIGFFGVDNPKVNYDNLSLISSSTYFLSNSLEKREYHDVLERLSYEDALTEMNNRNKYEHVIEWLKENKPQSVGVAYIDLNGLKTVNDKFGHKVGDELIKKAAKNISAVFDKKAFRIGGDEFVVIASNVSYDDFDKEVEQVISLMKKDEVSISIGRSWSDANVDILSQIHEADEKMYLDKKRYYENSAVDRRSNSSGRSAHFAATQS